MKITLGSALGGFSSIGAPRCIGMTVGVSGNDPQRCGGEREMLGFMPDTVGEFFGAIEIMLCRGVMPPDLQRGLPPFQ